MIVAAHMKFDLPRKKSTLLLRLHRKAIGAWNTAMTFPFTKNTLHWTWICLSAISCSWLQFTVMHYWLSRLNVQCSFQLKRFQGKRRTFRWKRILHFWSLITKYKLAVSACNQNYAGKTKQGHINIQFLMLLFSIVWKATKRWLCQINVMCAKLEKNHRNEEKCKQACSN